MVKNDKHFGHTDYVNNKYKSGDRYDVDQARVVRDRETNTGSKWLLPLLIIPLLALGLWAGGKFAGTTNQSDTTTAQSSQNYKAATGIGGGPGVTTVVTVTPTSSVQSSSQTNQNIPQAGIGGSGSDSSTRSPNAIPTSAPSTGHAGRYY